MNQLRFLDPTRTQFEDVPAFKPKMMKGKATNAATPDGPDHPEYPPASDDLEFQNILSPCGDEDRVPVTDSAKFPWSAICYLIITKGGSKWRGTGFFIGENTVVTAGHCIFSPRSGTATHIQVIPGRQGGQWPFGSAMATDFHTPDEWTRSQDVRFDYGVVKLPDADLGSRVGHFQIASLSTDRLEKAKINTAGFPSDMRDSTVMHFNAGFASDVEPQRLWYSLDTWKGASGSPIWLKTDEGNRVAVGIHNYGHCPNKATRINARVLRDLTEWEKL